MLAGQLSSSRWLMPPQRVLPKTFPSLKGAPRQLRSSSKSGSRGSSISGQSLSKHDRMLATTKLQHLRLWHPRPPSLALSASAPSCRRTAMRAAAAAAVAAPAVGARAMAMLESAVARAKLSGVVRYKTSLFCCAFLRSGTGWIQDLWNHSSAQHLPGLRLVTNEIS